MNITYLVGMTAISTIWLGGNPTVGYLARVGPAPLRFQTPARGVDITVILPPLAMRDPEPVVEFLGPPIPDEAPAPESIPTNASAQATGPVAPDPLANLSPQMLIQYFNSKNTNQDYNVLVPYQFSPPPAANLPAPPSRATYEVK